MHYSQEHYASADGLYLDRVEVIDKLQNDNDYDLCPMGRQSGPTLDAPERFENTYEDIEGFTPINPKLPIKPKPKLPIKPLPKPIPKPNLLIFSPFTV